MTTTLDLSSVHSGPTIVSPDRLPSGIWFLNDFNDDHASGRVEVELAHRFRGVQIHRQHVTALNTVELGYQIADLLSGPNSSRIVVYAHAA